MNLPSRQLRTSNFDIVEAPPAGELVSAARAIVDARSTRRSQLGDELFSDAVWDMILDIFIAESTERETDLTGACLSAKLAPTTALRTVKALVAAGHLVRNSDRRDRRRVHVRLSAATRTRVEIYLSGRYPTLEA